MILCVQKQKLEEVLATVSPLMDKYQRREQSFPDDVTKWLEDAEKTMSQLRLPEGSEMSVLRGRITKSVEVAQVKESTRAAVRLARTVTAAEALERAEEILRQKMLAAEERLRMFEDKVCEGMTAFLLQNETPDRDSSPNEWLGAIWKQFSAFQATRPLAIYLSASLSYTDRLFILGRVLERIKDNEVAAGSEQLMG